MRSPYFFDPLFSVTYGDTVLHPTENTWFKCEKGKGQSWIRSSALPLCSGYQAWGGYWDIWDGRL